MKTLKLLGIALIVCFSLTTIQAQTAEEIIDTYIENIGGEDAWSEVESMKLTGIGRQQGVDYPFTAYFMKDGRHIINIDLQGNMFTFQAFDGERSWAMNFNTQKPEAADAETSLNTKNAARDEMMSPFLDYKDKGYTVELAGKETWEGTEVYKITLTKTPVMIDGKEVENVEVYYFDVENFVPLAAETTMSAGQANVPNSTSGIVTTTVFSDYQEIDGLYVPFSQIDKINGQVGLEMLIKKVEFNTDVDEDIFKMPED